MIRRAAAFLALFAMGALDVHAQTARPFPSLAKRPVEAVDRFAEPAAPAAVQPAAPDPTLAQTVERLRASAAEADSAFQAQIGRSRAAVQAAGGAAPVSEAWVAAQMAISTADAARYESVAALASLDTLHVDRMATADGARAAADAATIAPARETVLAMVDAQNDALDGLRTTLTRP